MSVTNIIHEPFSHEDTAAIVNAVHERLGTTEWLKEAILAELGEILDVDHIPERVQTWVQRYYQQIISPDIPQRELAGKSALPIDKRSLKKRR